MALLEPKRLLIGVGAGVSERDFVDLDLLSFFDLASFFEVALLER